MNDNLDSPHDEDIDKLTFEQAMTKLDETVRALEAGDLPLEKATSLYETGMELARVCNEMLGATELKITQIQTAYGDQMQFLDQGFAEEE